MPSAIGSELMQRLESLKSARANFDSTWDRVQQIVWPEGGQFRRMSAAGETKTDEVYDMKAALGLERFGAAMESFLTPRHQQWHRLRASLEELNDDPSVKEWFEKATDVLFRFRNSPRARFYGQMHEGYKSLGAYGNDCIFVDENPGGGTRYKYNHVGNTWMETNFEDIVDTVYYEYELSAKAAHQRWGDDAPQIVKTKLQVAPFDRITFLHVVRPNENVDPERIGPEGMPFESYDVCCHGAEIIGKKGGYHEFPYMWSRYTVNPSENYGRGPAMLVRPNIQTLQEMKKTFLRSGHKVADPPLLVADDGELGRGDKTIRMGAGGVTYGGVDAQGRQTIIPFQSGARLDITREMMRDEHAVIDEVFLVSLFDIFLEERVQMTATEVLERAKEKGQIITPTVGRQHTELLGPMIERELGVAQRQGHLAALPPALVEAEGEYEIEYESDATRMQKSASGAAITRVLEVLSPFVQVNPSILDKFKQEELVDELVDVFGASPSIINTADEMKVIRQAQQEQLERQQGIEEAQAGAGVVRDLSVAGAA